MEKEPSVRRTATAPEPPVRVASETAKCSMLRSSSIRAIMMSLISRALSQETTRPALIWPELDPVGHVEDAVQHAEAGVGEVEDRGVAADAEPGGDPAGGGRLELLPADAGVDQNADIVGDTPVAARAFFAAAIAPWESG